MPKRRKKQKTRRPRGGPAWGLYRRACRLAEGGRAAEAEVLYWQVAAAREPRLQALALSDLAALLAVRGDLGAARAGFEAALALDPGCGPARANLACLAGAPQAAAPLPAGGATAAAAPPAPAGCKVALVSFLFNWPSTGGGIVHTVELADFLGRAGYGVKHFYARHRPWGVGLVEAPLPFPSEALEFAEADWDAESIQARYRDAIGAFDPDRVIITDSWNFKPLLAEALGHFPYLLRLQAMECLCPLNNLRFLPEPGGRSRQCPLDQLASPADCARCVSERGHLSGGLHRAERALSGVGSPGYHGRLLRSFAGAEAVLAVNPPTAALVRPFARRVEVVTAGMDPARFPAPWPGDPGAARPALPMRILFAGLVDEWTKGFRVAHEACGLLWGRRQDFELVATADPVGRADEFTRLVGWLGQAELPRELRAADVVVPAIAQEALGRTAVEAMAAGVPVVASRIGGLPATVIDGETGLLCEPGDAADLAGKLGALLDDPALRRRMGEAGRRRFQEHYAWGVIIDRHYRPLLAPRPRGAAAG